MARINAKFKILFNRKVTIKIYNIKIFSSLFSRYEILFCKTAPSSVSLVKSS